MDNRYVAVCRFKKLGQQVDSCGADTMHPVLSLMYLKLTLSQNDALTKGSPLVARLISVSEPTTR